MFGFTKRNGEIVEIPAKIAVARRIIELRDAGKTLREIRENLSIKMAMSTIQQIIKNRKNYER